MPPDDNAVNIQKKPYHHGDLRAALIQEGVRLLGERDVETLSLREVARNVGVTPTSVYRHFPDKQALMTALAGEGIARLAVVQRQAFEAAGGGAAGFAATGRAYVRFALANPALFRLVFASPPAPRAEGEGGPDAMAFLRQNAAAASGAAPGSAAAQVEAVRAWSLVHGLAMLMLDGQIAPDERLIDQAIGGAPPG
jgi:AcrR family transcriptional regulator